MKWDYRRQGGGRVSLAFPLLADVRVSASAGRYRIDAGIASVDDATTARASELEIALACESLPHLLVHLGS